MREDLDGFGLRLVGIRPSLTELRERAQAARLSMGAYLRRRALGQRVRIAAELRLGAAELRELNRIGVNLNQMARALNSGAVSSRGTGLAEGGRGDRQSAVSGRQAADPPSRKRLRGTPAEDLLRSVARTADLSPPD